MLDLLSVFNLSWWEWGLAILCALMFGFSRTAFNSVSILAIPLMAAIFGGKTSSAIVLPLLIAGDLMAVKKYNTNTNWSYLLRLLPWSLGGLTIGVLVGNLVNDRQFTLIVGFSVLLCLVFMIWLERRGNAKPLPNPWWLGALIGLAGGFTTMIGNAAGPVINVYFLAMRLPKFEFIGTSAWYYLIVNLAKVPLQIFVWKAVTPSILAFATVMIPVILIGAVIGIKTVRRIPEKPFRMVVTALTGAAVLKLFF
ncbi:MAG TPA: sulfite exporter TauE/SafE family protein [Firmicutes bacterium]|jgi:hypothetical protein|nr:sulfite exporter TauE/SafE family protein [Bacillota bacterium]HBR35284.1 sulfite exporter TauE/SafE family protein [Bacillota bacterium]